MHGQSFLNPRQGPPDDGALVLVDESSQVGERRTSQREAITAAIRQSKGPLAVEEILHRARKMTRTLGIATVYRTLKLLTESGQVHALTLSDGQIRYEAADLGHHHHFHCRACGRVFDLPGCPIKRIEQDIPVPEGFQIEDHELTLNGLCAACAASD
ncbi:MAG: transcriptional repressor [Phycisphaeraceae bacterium]|nr:transcriptional repressor [Phycisphaeraceae bacterium]